MSTSPFQAKVSKSGGRSTCVFIRSGDVVIHTELVELVACEFPVHASSPVHVEIPANRVKSFVVGPFRSKLREAADVGYPDTIKFPVYEGQDIASQQIYQMLPGGKSDDVLAMTPIVALATSVRGVVDGKIVQSHSVLPIWNDGSAVLVRLDWCEGEPSEGTPNPEWHMSASSGLPAALALEQLARDSLLPSNASSCRYQLHLTPWLLGAELLEDKGKHTAHRVWQREWQFRDMRELSGALNRISSGLVGPEPTRSTDAA